MAPRHTMGSKPPQRASLSGNRRLEPRRVPSRQGPGRDTAQRPPRRRSTLLGAALGVLLGAGLLGSITWASGCSGESPPPGPSATGSTSSDPFGSLPAPPTMPDDSNAPVVEEPDPPAKADNDDEPEKPWEGPWLGALAQSTPIYPTARFSRNRMGYIRRGGKVPVIDKPIKTSSCKQGFYPLVDGGYVCGKYATLKVDDPRVKQGIKPPNIEGLLPYKYAYNTKHGTPLYAQVPSRDEMLKYEPYLEKKKKKKPSGDEGETKPAKSDSKDDDAEAHAEKADQPRPSDLDGDEGGQFLRDGGLALPQNADSDAGDDDAEEPAIPWWQADKDKPVNVTLAELEESDGTLSKRMVKGFFIAIDRTFGWNNRMWYKTTTGLIAPADRMIIPKTPDLKGIAFEDGFSAVGFIRAGKAYKYEIKAGDKTPKRKGRVARFTAVGLTGKTHLYKQKRYRETVDGWWMRDRDGTYTEPGKRPDEVGPNEKWVDVNVKRKTLVAFEGDKPVYASLVSPGKSSSKKKRDHRTPTGKWRIREKHISATMDGDGIAGDLPYSIHDVPYVQYYEGSYALHGAFWHNNFGREQSHGCVNLAPLDAKHMFFWTEPQIPRGWHGVWSSQKRKGTLVVVHK